MTNSEYGYGYGMEIIMIERKYLLAIYAVGLALLFMVSVGFGHILMGVAITVIERENEPLDLSDEYEPLDLSDEYEPLDLADVYVLRGDEWECSMINVQTNKCTEYSDKDGQ
ncbi:hypothetical protein ACFSC6_12105 [Rufibacter sediminis]|uniref:Uncharacterized protein n=1 Tax=Rufibacter sediminis TaxID=2762756 RepID=A0ABR6VU06_9BACT|nr:hypothetical protein [Rufibacter sediminis]MBC3540625.1 hypothetical protein [Rufibacter sediminis]